jgi:hypothetical protein
MDISEFATRRLLESTGASEHLSDREKHFIGIAVAATQVANQKGIACKDGACTVSEPHGDRAQAADVLAVLER